MLRPVLFASAIVLLSATAAAALCTPYPDDASTGYVANSTAHAICLQQELAQRTNEAAERARIDALLGNIAIEVQRQRQQIMLPPVPPVDLLF